MFVVRELHYWAIDSALGLDRIAASLDSFRTKYSLVGDESLKDSAIDVTQTDV